MLSKSKIGAEDATAPIAMCGYFNRNQAANTANYIYVAPSIKFLTLTVIRPLALVHIISTYFLHMIPFRSTVWLCRSPFFAVKWYSSLEFPAVETPEPVETCTEIPVSLLKLIKRSAVSPRTPEQRTPEQRAMAVVSETFDSWAGPADWSHDVGAWTRGWLRRPDAARTREVHANCKLEHSLLRDV